MDTINYDINGNRRRGLTDMSQDRMDDRAKLKMLDDAKVAQAAQSGFAQGSAQEQARLADALVQQQRLNELSQWEQQQVPQTAMSFNDAQPVPVEIPASRFATESAPVPMTKDELDMQRWMASQEATGVINSSQFASR